MAVDTWDQVSWSSSGLHLAAGDEGGGVSGPPPPGPGVRPGRVGEGGGASHGLLGQAGPGNPGDGCRYGALRKHSGSSKCIYPEISKPEEHTFTHIQLSWLISSSRSSMHPPGVWFCFVITLYPMVLLLSRRRRVRVVGWCSVHLAAPPASCEWPIIVRVKTIHGGGMTVL